MIYRGPDHAVSRYDELRSLVVPGGLDPYPTKGSKCSHCGGGPAKLVGVGERKPREGRRDERLRCCTCEEPWVGIPIPEDRGVQVSRRHNASRREEMLCEMRDIGFGLDRLLEQFPTAFHIYVGLYCWANAGNAAAIAITARELWPMAPVGREIDVKHLIRRGREIVGRELAHRGLLDEGWR